MIRVTNITKRFGATTVLDRVSFEVEDPGSCVISGPSGCGKTTLLRLIAGLDLPEEGEVSLGGDVVSTPAWGLAPYLRHIGFVFQSPALWPHLTVAEHAAFGLTGLGKREVEQRVKEVLADTDLTHLAGRYPSKLSGGEKRRVAIARALAPRPRYLLMDEPLVNLDDELKTKLLTLIRDFTRRPSGCLIFVTHDRDEGAYLSDHMLTMKKGRILGL